MPEKIRWGLLSTANINRRLIGPMRTAERSELVAVASRSNEKAQAYADEQNIPKAYGSYDALLAASDIDAIYIGLPNTLHAEWAIKAADAGKHVLLEKPSVMTLDELDQVEAAANTNNVTIFEAFQYLHHPQTLKAQELIQEGKIGTLSQINAWFHFYIGPERAENIRLRPEVGGGSFWDGGVYPNAMAVTMAMAGAPTEVWASQIVGETGVDVGMRAQLQFSNNVVAQISSGFRTPARADAFLVGDEGMIHMPSPWIPGLSESGSHITVTALDGTSETIRYPQTDPYQCEVEAMEACILDGTAPVLTFSRSRDFLKSALAVYESARSGEVVRLSQD